MSNGTKNPIQALFEAGIVETTDFPADSRYHGIATHVFVAADGRQLPYLSRRFVPPPESFATTGYRRVKQDERLDQLAAETLGNPEAFWLHCDANRVLWAEELELSGRELRLTLPQGVPAPEDDA